MSWSKRVWTCFVVGRLGLAVIAILRLWRVLPPYVSNAVGFRLLNTHGLLQIWCRLFTTQLITLFHLKARKLLY